MTAPTTRKPSKKAFHFPKSSVTPEAEGETAKPARKSSAKPANTKSVAVEVSTAGTAADAPVSEAPGKVKSKRAKKEKVVRDSFTMPRTDYDRIALLKRKCLEAGVTAKKSELLRAGLQMLESAPAKRLVAAISALETVKTGRPAKGE
ncbi:hypothetical protein [Paraburkholderia sp. HP33-1]|uniref:hypothetical protein n=1 Tax=Paraburkholderia sp. HP33-1 TaxID=2883243 RepID=UPI001F2147E5|nr:hypothetical protein [Paraburkholderia sp. HP33-1]